MLSGRGAASCTTILIENMRREGFELAAAPRVVLRTIDGVTCEPYESLSVDVEEIPGRDEGSPAPRRLTNMELTAAAAPV
jgi:predicted membrane GTPase involved in stress response